MSIPIDSWTTHSIIPTVAWPPILSTDGAQLLLLLNFFQESEKLSSVEIRTKQFEQLFTLLQYITQAVPFYRERLAAILPLQEAESLATNWHKIPLLTKQIVHQAGQNFFNLTPPPEHGVAQSIPVQKENEISITVLKNNAVAIFENALVMREHVWHQRNFSGAIGLIREKSMNPQNTAKINHYPSWGIPLDLLVKTGKVSELISMDPQEQAQWLKEVNPDYLFCHPTIWLKLLDYYQKNNIVPSNLKEVRTQNASAMITAEIRRITKEKLGLKIVDIYSSPEVGYIAVQCPAQEHYHIQAENLLVEILNANNQPCQPGEVGKVVVTTLHNFASPLIRYEIGDYAVMGSPCSCGRNLPVIQRIIAPQKTVSSPAQPGGQKLTVSFA